MWHTSVKTHIVPHQVKKVCDTPLIFPSYWNLYKYNLNRYIFFISGTVSEIYLNHDRYTVSVKHIILNRLVQHKKTNPLLIMVIFPFKL